MGKSKYDTEPLPKGTIDAYLKWRKHSQWALPDPIPDNVYQTLVYRGENLWYSNKNSTEEHNLTPEENRLAKSLWEGVKKFRDKRRRGPIY